MPQTAEERRLVKLHCAKRWQAEHPEQVKAYRLAHKSQQLARSRAWRRANPERAREHVRKWQAENREHVLAYKKRWREAHPEQHHAYAANWSKAHPVERCRRAIQWAKDNPEKANERNHRHRARLRGARAEMLTPDQLQLILEAQGGRCRYCRVELGQKRHLDHRTPLVRGGKHSLDNLCWACAPCNLRKGPKTAYEFLRECA